ncbi:MAG: DUF481 domain-containing protein [Limisphaerales bacterium]
MKQHLQNMNRLVLTSIWLAVLLVCALNNAVSAQEVILHLKSGDKISGLIVSESAGQVVISNAWVRTLSIPRAEISSRELEKGATIPPLVSPPQAKPMVATTMKSALKPVTKSKGKWCGDARLGLDAIASTTDQQDYSGSLKLTYEQPYKSDPKKFFKNTSDFNIEYQRTDGQESANRACASNKSDFDIGKKSYGYSLFGVAHDYVQKIDAQYQISPGGGVHLIKQPNFVMNLEGGMDYQYQYRMDTPNLETFSFRLAEDITWIIQKNLKLTENLAFYPNVEDNGQFRNDFQSVLSYGFWKNLSVNLTALDCYDTQVAADVDRNRFEIRSSLGITF